MIIDGYDTGGWYDEVFDPEGKPRPEAEVLLGIINSQPEGEFQRLQETANAALVNLGITFNVYGDSGGVERVLPFDIFPRIVRDSEWDQIERGLKQRIYALNLFLQDIYNEAKILRDGVVPQELVLSAPSLSKSLLWPDAAQRHLVSHHRHGPSTRPRRPFLRARGQPALPFRRVLRPREPAPDEADVSQALHVIPGAARGRLPE